MGIYYSSVGTRLRNYLHEEGLTVEDFAVLAPQFVRYVHNLGKKSEVAVLDRLEELGLEPGKYEGPPGMRWYEVVPYYKKHKEEILKENPIVRTKPEKEEKKDEDSDWSVFRRETAKDILCSLLSGQYATWEPQRQIEVAISYTDKLIQELKEKQAES